jgi:cytidylate kinase
MKLIFIYGPPASGKLTIAKELSDLTGYSIFHNHQTRDIVRELYPETFFENYDLVDTLCLDIFEYAAKHDTNLIFTLVHDDPDDIIFADKAIKSIENKQGTVCFIEVTAPNDVLLSRVDNDSRKEYRKMRDKAKLERLLGAGLYGSLPYEGILKIDTGLMSADESAMLIAEHFRLPAHKGSKLVH